MSQKKKLSLMMAVVTSVLIVPAIAFAQSAAANKNDTMSWLALGAAIAIGLAALGGTTAQGRKYLRSCKKKRESHSREEKEAIRRRKYFRCALTDRRLREPMCCCRLGHLFNKESLIERLLVGGGREEHGGGLPKAFRHIKGLRDQLP